MSWTCCSIERELLGLHLLDDVVDDEDVVVGQVGLERGLDVAAGGGDDLHLVAAEALDLLEQEDVGRLGHRDGQHALDQEQRQDLVLFQELLGQDADDLGIGDARARRARRARRSAWPAPR